MNVSCTNILKNYFQKWGGKIKVGSCNSEEIFESFKYSTTRKTSFIFYRKSSYNENPEPNIPHSAIKNSRRTAFEYFYNSLKVKIISYKQTLCYPDQIKSYNQL